MAVTREKLLAFGKKRRFETVSIPGLGDVRIRSLKELERSQFERDYQGTDNPDRQLEGKRALIAACVCNEDGEPLLTAADIAELAEHDGAFTGFLFDKCWKLCGFSRLDIESIVGNLQMTPAADSP